MHPPHLYGEHLMEFFQNIGFLEITMLALRIQR